MRTLILIGLVCLVLGAAPGSPVGVASAAPCHQNEDGGTTCECPPPPSILGQPLPSLGPECT